MSRSTRNRYARTDAILATYMTLKKSGVPSWVTSHEAYRMTEGRVGTEGDNSGANGFTLMNLVRRADGNVVALADLETVPPLAEQGKILRSQFLEDDGTEAESLAEVQPPKTTGPQKGDVVSYALHRSRKGVAPRWEVRHVDPDGTLTLDLLGSAKRSTARFGVDPAKVVVRSH